MGAWCLSGVEAGVWAGVRMWAHKGKPMGEAPMGLVCRDAMAGGSVGERDVGCIWIPFHIGGSR
jgi:hypothetical protein